MFLTRRLPLRGGAVQLAGMYGINVVAATKKMGILPAIGADDNSVVISLKNASTREQNRCYYRPIWFVPPSRTGISIVTFWEIMDRRRLHLLQIKGQSHSSLPPFRTLLLCAQTQSRLLPCKHHKLAVIQSKWLRGIISKRSISKYSEYLDQYENFCQILNEISLLLWELNM